MTFSPLISGTIPAHDKFNARPGRVIRVIQHHWADTTMGGENSLASPGRKASVNYLVHNDGTIIGQVPEEYRPWTSGGAAADNPSITIEVQDHTGSPDWTISDAAMASLGRLLADIADRHVFSALDGTNYRGHREFAATACPGPFLFPRLQEIRDAANAIRGGNVIVVDNPLPPPVVVGDPVLRQGSTGPAVVRLQTFLGISPDGIFGQLTKQAVEDYQGAVGLTADGIVGALTWAKVNAGVHPTPPPAGPVVIAAGVPAPTFPLPAGCYFGPKTGPSQSVSGYYSHRADLERWQQRMASRGWAITVDGLYGPQTQHVAELFQAEKALTVDGLIGPITWSAAWTAPITY